MKLARKWFAVTEEGVYFGVENTVKAWAKNHKAIINSIPPNFSADWHTTIIKNMERQIDELHETIFRAIKEDRPAGALSAMRKCNQLKSRIWEHEGLIEVDKLDRNRKSQSVPSARAWLCFSESKRANRRITDYAYVEELIFIALQNGLKCPFCGRIKEAFEQ